MVVYLGKEKGGVAPFRSLNDQLWHHYWQTRVYNNYQYCLYCYHNYNNDTIDGENHVDAPVSTIIISIVYIVIIINHDDTDTIDGGQSCWLTRARRHKYGWPGCTPFPRPVVGTSLSSSRSSLRATSSSAASSSTSSSASASASS